MDETHGRKPFEGLGQAPRKFWDIAKKIDEILVELIEK